MTCEHKTPTWHLAPANEQGWTCNDCGAKPGEPAGYMPAWDYEHIREKVDAILLYLHMADIVYVSNSDHGGWTVAEVCTRCRKEGVYDQLSIVRYLAEALDHGTHAQFWKDRGEKILAGKDDRPRCDCGALATVSQGDKRWCSQHSAPLWAGLRAPAMSAAERDAMDKALSEWSSGDDDDEEDAKP